MRKALVNHILKVYLHPNDDALPDTCEKNNRYIPSSQQTGDDILLDFVQQSYQKGGPFKTEYRLLNLKLALRHAIAEKDKSLISLLTLEIENTCIGNHFESALSDVYLMLIQYYAGTQCSDSMEQYQRKFEQTIKVSELYKVVKKYTSLVNFYLNNNILDKKNHEVKTYIDELSGLITLNDNCTIQKHFGFIQLVYHWYNRDYISLRDTCLRYICILQDCDETPEKHLSLFFSNLSISQLYLGEYQKAITTINASEKYVKVGSHNWAKEQIVKVAVLNYNTEYDKAYHTTLEVVNHKGFRKLRMVVQEEWLIICAFMAMLVKIGKISPELSDKKIADFRLNKFLNEIPIYSKDKTVTNATILIAHICHLIIDQKYSQAIDRIEAIEKYCSRYLRVKSESFRLNCFLKMVLVIPKVGFHQAGVKRCAEKYVSRLSEQSIADTRQQIITEILPYEDLWEMMFDQLKNKNYKPRKTKSLLSN